MVKIRHVNTDPILRATYFGHSRDSTKNIQFGDICHLCRLNFRHKSQRFYSFFISLITKVDAVNLPTITCSRSRSSKSLSQERGCYSQSFHEPVTTLSLSPSAPFVNAVFWVPTVHIRQLLCRHFVTDSIAAGGSSSHSSGGHHSSGDMLHFLMILLHKTGVYIPLVQKRKMKFSRAKQ